MNAIKLLRPIYIPIVFYYRKYSTLLYSKLYPYKYNKLRYRETFLYQDSEIEDSSLRDANKVVYCFWTGDNEICYKRKRSLKQLKENIGVPLILITPKELDEYILPDFPLHPAYKYLSYIQKSDYLRCYFMHHYGGGYTDIKECTSSWNEAFDMLNNSDKYIIGYPEGSHFGVCVKSTYGVISNDLQNYWRYVAGAGAYIHKPYTKYTEEWYNELLSRMDYYARALKANPGDERRRDNLGYPIRWTDIAGNITQPLFLKYNHKVIQSSIILPNFADYR